MKIKTIILLSMLLFLLLASFVFGAENIDCYVASSCAAVQNEVIKMTSAGNDAHAGDKNVLPNSGYAYSLCCDTPSTTSFQSGISNFDNSTFGFSLVDATNSEIQMAADGTQDYYLGATQGFLVCRNSTSCSADEDCVIGFVPSGLNYHPSNCSNLIAGHSRLCCKLYNHINVSGTIQQENTDGSIGPAADALVEIRLNRDDSLLAFTKTDSSGDYNISLAYDYAEPFNIIIKKAKYVIESRGPEPSTSDVAIIWSPILELASECQPDCTMGDGYCYADCDGKNGCSYIDNSYKTTCDGLGAGWLKPFNDTHDYECCNSLQEKIFDEIKASSSINVTTEVSNLVTYSPKTLLWRGKVIDLVVSMWE